MPDLRFRPGLWPVVPLVLSGSELLLEPLPEAPLDVLQAHHVRLPVLDLPGGGVHTRISGAEFERQERSSSRNDVVLSYRGGGHPARHAHPASP